MHRIPFTTTVNINNSVIIVTPKNKEKQLVQPYQFKHEYGERNSVLSLYEVWEQVFKMFDLNEGDNEAAIIDIWEEATFSGVIYRYTEFCWYRHSYTGGSKGDVPSLRAAHGND